VVLTTGTRWQRRLRLWLAMKIGGADHTSTLGRDSGCGVVKVMRGMGVNRAGRERGGWKAMGKRWSLVELHKNLWLRGGEMTGRLIQWGNKGGTVYSTPRGA
jgi:hypothetical protein